MEEVLGDLAAGLSLEVVAAEVAEIVFAVQAPPEYIASLLQLGDRALLLMLGHRVDRTLIEAEFTYIDSQSF